MGAWLSLQFKLAIQIGGGSCKRIFNDNTHSHERFACRSVIHRSSDDSLLSIRLGGE